MARFNSGITEKLLAGAREALTKAGAKSSRRIPRSRRVRTAACGREAAGPSTRRGYHAIIALGAVIRGETPHFDYVAGEAARGLQQVALETGIPVAFGVLTTDTSAQAEARAGGAHGNKGYDAAMTAIEMARFAISVDGE